MFKTVSFALFFFYPRDREIARVSAKSVLKNRMSLSYLTKKKKFHPPEDELCDADLVLKEKESNGKTVRRVVESSSSKREARNIPRVIILCIRNFSSRMVATMPGKMVSEGRSSTHITSRNIPARVSCDRELHFPRSHSDHVLRYLDDFRGDYPYIFIFPAL